jgi:hypothetical protein
MPEAIGGLIIAGLDAAGVTGVAGFSLASTTIGGVGIATIAGSATILAATIGLQYALMPRPGLPPAQAGSQPIKQAVPPRIRGYGINRMAGYYMLYEAAGSVATAYTVQAFHSGRIGGIVGLFLHDDEIGINGGIPPNAPFYGVVQNGYSDGRYGGGNIQLEARLGAASQPGLVDIITSDPLLGGIWDSSHQGNGIAYIGMECAGVATVSDFTKIYPHQFPLLSVIAECSPIWDPRDPAQLQSDQSTWQVSYNPVIQLIDYLTRADGGMGLDFSIVIEPNLAAWLGEADICDALVDTAGATGEPPTEPRYKSSGWFQYDNDPADVIGGLLSTCDGWLAEAGDGSLALTVGLYRVPLDPPLTQEHIFGFALNYGIPDEQLVNQLEISFTDPNSNYVEVQTAPWVDLNSVALTGTLRSQPMDLKWVQSNSQARRLAGRAMQRLNPVMNGQFTTTLYGLRYLGKRWIPLQYPYVSGLQNSVVEIQNAEIDLMAGRIVWTFILIDPATIEAYNPDTDEGGIPYVPPRIPHGLTFDFSDVRDSQYLALLEDI